MRPFSLKNKFRCLYIGSDILALIIAYFLTNNIRFFYEEANSHWDTLREFLFGEKSIAVSLYVLLLWGIIIFLSGYYNNPFRRGRINDLANTLATTIIAGTLQYLFIVTDDLLRDTKRLLPLYFILLGCYFLCIYITRSIISYYKVRWLASPSHFLPVAIIGSPLEIGKIKKKSTLLHIIPAIEINIEEFITDHSRGEQRQYELTQLITHSKTILDKTKVSAIYLAVRQEESPLGMHLLYSLYAYRCDIYITAESIPLSLGDLYLGSALSIPLIQLSQTNMKEYEKNIKWVVDKGCSLIAMLLLSPLYLSLAYLVKKSSPGPIFYKQERIGRFGKPFLIYKFRTMYIDSEKNGPCLSHENDPRITPLGKVLRKYRLDELPQFFNVFRGDMSLVGPRPERAYYIERLIEEAPYYYLLHNVLPGITSLGMVTYGYASTLEEMKERLQSDWIYYKNMSLTLDLKILLATFKTLLRGKGK